MRFVFVSLLAFLTASSADAQIAIYSTPQVTAAAPTISSGFGTSPSIVNSAGPAAFTVNVGTGGTASSGVIQMPLPTNATHGWICGCQDITTVSAAVSQCRSVPTTASTITLTNYTDLSVAGAWVASDVLNLQCSPY